MARWTAFRRDVPASTTEAGVYVPASWTRLTTWDAPDKKTAEADAANWWPDHAMLGTLRVQSVASLEVGP